MEIRLKNLKTKENLKKHIIENGSFSPEENERVYNKFFAPAPRYLFKAVNEKYNLVDKELADVGCGYGMPLVFCKEGSYGVDIDVEDTHIPFGESIGLTIYKRNVMDDDVLDLPKVDAVWNSAVMEHVDSPHILLRKMWQMLKPNGLLFLYVPTIPFLRIPGNTPFIGKYFIGHTHGDHVSAYTPRTLQFFCEYAGFETIENSAFFPGPLKIFNKMNLIDGTIYVGRKNADWEYADNSTRKKADNPKGYVFK